MSEFAHSRAEFPRSPTRVGRVSRQVAFFRNLNLGQRRSRSPTRPELLTAFERAGALHPINFQVNGTVIFETDEAPQELADRVVDLLTPVCGYDDVAVVRSLDWVLGLDLDDLPVISEVSLFHGPDPFPEQLPWAAPKGGLTVVGGDGTRSASTTSSGPAVGPLCSSTGSAYP
jgi:hypothetical protein